MGYNPVHNIKDGAHPYEALMAFFCTGGDSQEGLVFYHPDGRMCKVTRASFGLAWGPHKAIDNPHWTNLPKKWNG